MPKKGYASITIREDYWLLLESIRKLRGYKSVQKMIIREFGLKR